MDIQEKNREKSESVNGDSKNIKLLSFSLEKQEYGINLLETLEVLDLYDITPVPHTPRFLLGVINLRGNILAVMDLKVFFEIDALPSSGRSRIIILNCQNKKFGILVDAVSGILEIKSDSIAPPPQTLSVFGNQYLLGVLHILGHPLSVIDPGKLLKSEKFKTLLGEKS